MEEVLAYATDLADNVALSSMDTIERQLLAGWSWDLATSNADTDEKMNHSLRQSDFKQGVQSFLEKRPPDFAPISRT